MSYVFKVRVTNVDERRRVVSADKDAKGDAVIVEEKMGWFVALDIGVAVGVGNEKPDFVKGDILELVLRKVGGKDGQKLVAIRSAGAETVLSASGLGNNQGQNPKP